MGYQEQKELLNKKYTEKQRKGDGYWFEYWKIESSCAGKRHEELLRLEKTLNEMMQRLAVAHQELRRMYEATTVTVNKYH